MPYYKNQDDMYGIHRALFDRFRSDPAVGPALAQSGLVLAFKVSQPDGLITINSRSAEPGTPFSYVFGEAGPAADLTFIAPADVIHEFWQGKINIVSALVTGKIKAVGNVAAAMKLMTALKGIFDLSPRVLRDIGRVDLVL